MNSLINNTEPEPTEVARYEFDHVKEAEAKIVKYKKGFFFFLSKP